MTPPSPFTAHLFGPLRVAVRGAPLPPVRTRSVEWLLALLLLRHGRAVERAWLAGMLWPDTEESRALQNLRNLLVSLRKALGPEAERLQTAAQGMLTLDLAGAEVDVARFDGWIAAGEEAGLRQAVAVYRGPLLEGCAEEWVLAEREARAEQCLGALEKLAAGAEGRGEHGEAIRYLRQAEGMDALRDSLQRRLMASLAAAGDPAAAIQVYRDFRSRLQSALVTAPDEGTTRLFHEIRAAARRRATEGARESERARERESERGDDASATPSLPRSLAPSLSAPRVPRPLTPLIGREREVTEVRERLRLARLVTLIGGGGVGKTRLALEVGTLAEEQFPGGTFWVELAPLADGARVMPSVAAVLDLRETGDGDVEPLEARLVARLSRGATLLALDNCEHVIDAAAGVVQSLLQHCPELCILATSRQRLGLPGEVAWRVPSLAAPDPAQLPADTAGAVDLALTFPAVRLFVERAVAGREAFHLASRDEVAAVCLICRRLDGIPLAIELAAARARVLAPPQIAARLDDRFRLLTTGPRGALPRHQTLRALIDWSYDQLPEAEARLLRQLGVFAGGWTLEAAEAVDVGVQVFRCSGVQVEIGVVVRGQDPPLDPNTRTPEPLNTHPSEDVLDLLDSLVDRSLVLAEAVGGELRYRMLETVREYALAKLGAQGEEEAVRAAHLACFLELGEAMGPGLEGPRIEATLTQLDAERDNLRSALQFSAEHETRCLPALPVSAGEAGLRLGAALWPYWETRGYLSEGRHQLRAALERSGLAEAPQRAQALLGAARLANHQFDLEEARRFAQESLERFRARGDDRGVAAALLCLGEVALNAGAHAVAGIQFAEGLEASRRSGWKRGSALLLLRIGAVAMLRGEIDRARSSLEEGRALAEVLGDAPALALAGFELASLAGWERDTDRAGPLLEQSLTLWRQLGHKRATAHALAALGNLAQSQGNATRATAFLEQAAATYRELGDRMNLAWRLMDLGSVHFRASAYAAASVAYEEGLANFRDLNYPYGIACASNNLGMTCFHLGDAVRAQALHREALALYQRCESADGIVWSLERLGVASARHGDPRRAARLLGAAAAARAELGGALTGTEASDLEQSRELLQEQLGPEVGNALWEEGRALSREAALAFAHDDTQA